jgi:phenylalanyl-tRNA synthetase beta subunit
LFEVGKFFRRESGLVKEGRRIGIAITGCRSEPFWQGAGRDEKYDIIDLKGIIEEFFDDFGIKGVVYNKITQKIHFF